MDAARAATISAMPRLLLLALVGFSSSESLVYISLMGSDEELSLLEGLELLERTGLVDEDGAPEVSLRCLREVLAPA